MYNEIMEKRQQADPRTSPWGVRTSDTYIEGCGAFIWYESEEALRNSLIEGNHAPDLDAEEWEEWQPEVEAALKEIRRIEPATAYILRDLMQEIINFEWWGQFDELCSGDSEIAVLVRRAFVDPDREDEEDDSIPRPVRPDEIDDFVQHIREWGF